MKSSPTPPPPTDQKKKKIIAVGAFSFSMLFHIVLLILTGGAVLIQGVIPKPTFTEYSPVVDDSSPPTDAVEETTEPQPENTEAPIVPSTETEQSMPAPEMTPITDLIKTDSASPLQNSVLPPAPVSMTATTDPNQTATPSNQSNTATKAGPASIRNMTSLFGSKGESADALVGYFYDLKQTPERKENELAEDPKAVKDYQEALAKFEKEKKGKEPVNPELVKNAKYAEILNDFLKSWDQGVLAKYYKATNPLSSYQMFIPSMAANEAPKAFDVERYVKPRRWVIYYKGVFVAPKTGNFRFVGMADDVLVVRFDKKVALNASLTGLKVDVTRELVDKTATMSRMFLAAGPWIHMSEGQSYPIEMITGEQPGGYFYSFLMIEEKGGKYPSRTNGSPLLPLFQMAPTKIPKFEPEKTGPAIAPEPFSGKA